MIIYKYIKQNYTKKIKIFCLTVYKKTDRFKKIFSQLENIKCDVRYLKIKHNMEIAVWQHHSKVFPQFKNAHLNQTAVLVATGPTLNYYTPLNNVVNFGVNKACRRADISLDYWFVIDYHAAPELLDEIKDASFKKFFGQCSSSSSNHPYIRPQWGERYHFTDYMIEQQCNAYKFYFDHPSKEVNRDIESQALPDLGSCVFPALYFAVYTGIKKIYIVGCDCALNGYFDKTAQKKDFNVENVRSGWNAFKYYIDAFHPEVELISVNPVGLKGLFHDVYTESYLNDHPEINRNDVEIL